MTELQKIRDLTPESRQVNVRVQVLCIDEPKEIPSRYGSPRKVSELLVGDETARIILSLWDDQIGTVTNGETLTVENGFITLVGGHMRLNVGKYGKLNKVEEKIESVAESPNVSDMIFERPPRRREFRRGVRHDSKKRFRKDF